jgi:dihydrodipicolinate synthase/N-acetylneuraminate lyase
MEISCPAIKPDAVPRREFLQFLGAGALGLALAVRSAKADTDSGSAPLPPFDLSPGPKKLRGLFPIGATPFTPDDKLDLESLAAQVTFCNRGGVHGFAWPQGASNWSALTESERMEGAEAILAAGKGGAATLVIGVQGKDMGAVTRYAKHAAKTGADAIISLPPVNVTDEKVLLDYYQQVGRLTELPLFVQSHGSMSVDLIVEIFKTVPTMRQIKDEAGVPLERVTELRRRTDDQLRVFSGQGALTLIREMELGVVGHCPYTGLADVFAAAYDLWHGGRRREGFDMFGRILAFGSLGVADQNRLLISRGVFKTDVTFRPAPSGAAAPPRAGLRISDQGVHDGLDHYLKPYLRA